MSQKRTGRIRPHQRDADQSGLILGSDLDLPADLKAKCNETLKLQMGTNCRRDYRQRLKRIINFWKEESPLYYEVGVTPVGPEDLVDETKYFFAGTGRSKEGFTEDLVYTGLNVEYVLLFLASTKKKSDGKIKSPQDLRKYKDAILWGAETAGARLPVAFHEKVDRFLASYKKEYQQAKKNGLVEETAADPITEPLYKLILQWALDANNIFVWFWTIAQWNFMARSASVDPLGFHNFSLGTDSIIGKYDDSKADKSGERLSEKNIYANPFEWKMCFWTGLGVWCSLNSQRLSKSERLFLQTDVKEGTAATKFCEQISSIAGQHVEELKIHVNEKNFNPYGLRKGAATHAVSGTTAAPSIPAVARRGEWSIGSVLDVYWHFGSVGDQYLGRILAGLNPNHVSFASLPPHWTVANPLANEDIKKAIDMTFPGLFSKQKQIIPILLRCFACMIYHSKELVKQMHRIPGHQFNKLAILHEPDLLRKLRELVTTDPTEDVLTTATGIPPHIELGIELKNANRTLASLIAMTQNQSERVIAAINEAFESKAIESGQVTGQKLKELLMEFRTSTLDVVSQKMTEMFNARVGLQQGEIQNSVDSSAKKAAARTNVFEYNGRWNAVPEHFKFPKADLNAGLRFWLKGQSVEGDKIVRPYRKIQLADLPPDTPNCKVKSSN